MSSTWLGRSRTKSSSSGNENLADSVDSLTSRQPKSSPESMQASTESLGRVPTATSSGSGHSSPGLRRAYDSMASLLSPTRSRGRSSAGESLSDSEISSRRGDGFEGYTPQVPHDFRETVEEAHQRLQERLAGHGPPPAAESRPTTTARYVPGTTDPILPWGHKDAPQEQQATSRYYSSSSASRGSRHHRQKKGPASPPVMRQRGGAGDAGPGNLSDIED